MLLAEEKIIYPFKLNLDKQKCKRCFFLRNVNENLKYKKIQLIADGCAIYNQIKQDYLRLTREIMNDIKPLFYKCLSQVSEISSDSSSFTTAY